MASEQQNDTLCINQVQLLLAEKRTVLAIIRTDIAVLILPLSVFNTLIATSKWYNVSKVQPLLVLAGLISLGLIVLVVYLIACLLTKVHRCDQMIIDIEQDHSSLRQLVQS